MHVRRERCRSAPDKARYAIPAHSDRTERSSLNKERAECEQREAKAYRETDNEMTALVNDKRHDRRDEAEQERR
jgi:hypothetical protein